MNSEEQHAVFIILIIFGVWAVGSLIVFFVEYIFDIEGDAAVPTIFAWPAIIPILLVIKLCHGIKQLWVVAGGPKLRGIAVRKRCEYEERKAAAYDELRISVRHARNSGVSNSEIASLIKDNFVREIMES
jgi:hypothetical protein